MAAVADTSLVGFNQSLKISRQSGNASTATISFGQVIETFDALRCQGQTVTLSFWAQGRRDLFRRPAHGANRLRHRRQPERSQPHRVDMDRSGQRPIRNQQTLTNGMTRYQFTGVVPATRRSSRVLLSFTPSGTAGADDSISINGVQLEIGASASPFERIDAQVVLEICQRYAWVQPEPAAGVVIGAGAEHRRLLAARSTWRRRCSS